MPVLTKKYIKEAKALNNATDVDSIFLVPLKNLEVLEDWNLRFNWGNIEEFAEWIRENGATFPPLKVVLSGGKFVIEQGHRRYKACLMANLDKDTGIPCFLGDPNISDAERIADQINSNEGVNYTWLEKMFVVKRLIQSFRWTVKDVTRKTGISASEISNMKHLFSVSNYLLLAITDGHIPRTVVIENLRNGFTEDEILLQLHQENNKVSLPEHLQLQADTQLMLLGGSDVIDVTSSVVAEHTFEHPNVVTSEEKRFEELAFAPITEDNTTDSTTSVWDKMNKPHAPTNGNLPKPVPAAPKSRHQNYKRMLRDLLSSPFDEQSDCYCIKVDKRQFVELMSEMGLSIVPKS